MKRAALAFALILGLVSVAVIVQRVSLTKANFYPFKENYCDISIHSPQSMTYESGNILLNFTVKTIDNIPPSCYYFYSLDGRDLQSSVKIEDVHVVKRVKITNDTLSPYTNTTLRGQAELPLLTNGSHSIKVFSGYYINGTIYHAKVDPNSATVEFNVGTASALSSFSAENTDGSLSWLLPTVPLIGFTGLVAVVGIVLLVYFKKRKH